jgi:hypothetical protein
MNQTANYSDYPDRVAMAVPMFCRYIRVHFGESKNNRFIVLRQRLTVAQAKRSLLVYIRVYIARCIIFTILFRNVSKNYVCKYVTANKLV